MARRRADPRGAWSLAFCVVILTAGAPAGAADSAPTALYEVAWTTDDLEGDFAVRIELGFSGATSCTARVAGAGAYRPYDLLLFLGRDSDGGPSGAIVGGGGQVVNVGAIGFQFHTTPNLYWIGAIEGSFTAFSGRQSWVFAGFGLQHLGIQHGITDHAFEVRVTCDKAFTVHGVHAAREAFGATHANLEHGVGVRLSPAGTGSSVNANVADGVTRTTTAPTLVLARSHGGYGGGVLIHESPQGLAVEPYSADTLHYRLSGTAGTHTLRLNHLAAPGTDLYMMILGFRDVGGISGLDTWPSLPTF